MSVFFGQNYLTIPGYGGFGDNTQNDPEDEPVWEGVGAVSLALTLAIPAAATGGGTLPDPGLDGPSVSWRPFVTLEDIDISELVVGDIEIKMAEGAARVATFRLLFAPGQTLTLASWTGHTVAIDYAPLIDGEVVTRARLFTGIVDTPAFDAQTGMVDVLATDDLQGELEAMSDAQIDALTGGRWSAAVFDEARSHGNQRANDRMSTRAASLDLDVWRTPRLTPWFAAPTLQFTADDIEDGSLSTTFAGRSALINRVIVEFNYRTPLVRARTYNLTFDSVLHAAGKFGQGNGIQAATWRSYVSSGHVILTRQAVEAAINQAGAEIAQIAWTSVPDSYGEGDWVWVSGPNSQYLCRGFTAQVTFNSGGELEERYTISVDAPLSIALAGVLSTTLSSALEGAYPEQTQVETQMAVNRALQIQAIPPKDYAPIISGRFTTARATLTPETDRNAANTAMACLIDIARTRIADAHRQNEAAATVLLNPDIDVHRHARLDTPRLRASGKVKSLTHRMSTDSGRAVTEFTLAISSSRGLGVIHPETPSVVLPEATLTTKAASGALCNFNSAPNEDHEFSVEFPGMADADRAMNIRDIPVSVQAAVHEDEFEVIT
jgi:hypothetical protein